MRVEVRLFANFREAAGSGSLELDADASTVGDVVDALLTRFPELEDAMMEGGEVRNSVRLLLNGKVAEAEAAVEEGDEVAVLPPVSGGLRLEFKAWLVNEDGEYVLGEGGAAILREIDREGSVRAAAEALDMSNRYALEKILSIEDRTGEEIVKRSRGGKGGGGSSLTRRGRLLLSAYEDAIECMGESANSLELDGEG